MSTLAPRRRTAAEPCLENPLLNRLMSLSPDGFALFDAENQLCYLSPDLQRAVFRAHPAPREVSPGPSIDLRRFEEIMWGLCQAQPAGKELPKRAGLRSRLDGVLLHLALDPPRTLACRVIEAAADHPPATSADNPQPGDWLIHFRDITRELEVDRLKSAFLSTAAHELRTPLASIYGFSDLLSKRSLPQAQVSEVAEIIHRQSGWLMSLINNLLDLARIDARGQEDARLTDLPLGVILDDTFHGIPSHEPPRQWQIECHDRAVLLRAERNRIKKALVQVLLNADQYSPAHQVVHLRTYPREHEGQDGVCIEVIDQGVGMTPEELSHIFERFWRAHPESEVKGNGLGMSLVQEVMQLHSGRVEVLSQPGQGTTVRLWLQKALAPERVADTRE